LQYPDFFGVTPNVELPRGRKPEAYSLEQLIIMEDQRVPLEKMSKKLSDKLLKASTLPPSDRFNKIMNHANQMGVFNTGNAVLRAFGISIDRSTNQVYIIVTVLILLFLFFALMLDLKIVVGVRPCPKICYGAGEKLDVDVEKVYKKLQFFVLCSS
jgi:hypothetical protein